MANLHRRQTNRCTACRRLRMQPPNHSAPSQKSRAQSAVCRAPMRQRRDGHHLLRTPFRHHVLFDSISGKALSVTEVKNETNALYAEAIGSLKAKGIEIQSIVCDGRKGLLQLFPDIPVQLCHFHQVKTVGRYLTRNPQTAAGKELWHLARTLKNSRRADFESSLKAWFEQHKDFFNERTKNPRNGQIPLHPPKTTQRIFQPETEHGQPICV